MEAIAWGAVLRVAQSALQGAPFIVTGLCITAMLHRLLGQKDTRRVFGSNTWASLIQSWVIGMLLPGCSLGVIPIVKQLKRSGIAVGTIFAFALSSPLFDPLSMLYGLTLSKPFTIVAFATCSLIVVTLSGSLFDWLFPDTERPETEPQETPYGIKRLLAMLVVMARESVGPSMGLIVCGLIGVGLLSTVLPAGSLQGTMQHNNPWSPILMTAVAIPAYATPMTAMGQLGSMFQHGNSIGAAFILLTFGAGMNLGLLLWMGLNYGLKKLVVWFGLMLAIVLGFSYGIEKPLYPTEIEPADHTHAFDLYCRPFYDHAAPVRGYAAEVGRRIAQEAQPHEIVGAGLLVALILLGGMLTCLDRWWVIESWLTRSPALAADGTQRPAYDLVVPGWVLCGVGVLGIIAMSVVGCFTYYPAVHEAIPELDTAKIEALGAALSGDTEHALHWIPIAENWNRRLQVGVYLRTGQLSDYHRMKSRIFRDRLEKLEHMLEDDDPREEITRQVSAAARAFSRVSTAYRAEYSSAGAATAER